MFPPGTFPGFHEGATGIWGGAPGLGVEGSPLANMWALLMLPAHMGAQPHSCVAQTMFPLVRESRQSSGPHLCPQQAQGLCHSPLPSKPYTYLVPGK